MKVKLSKREINSKERIVLLFEPKSALEEKAMRSIAVIRSSNLQLIPETDIVLQFPNYGRARSRKYEPSETSKREYLASQALIPLPADSAEEQEAARAMRTIGLARSLGIKLPQGTKLVSRSCRCGLSYVDPRKWLAHQKICPVLHKSREVLQYAQDVLNKHKEEDVPKKREKVEFSCRCGHVFPSKNQLAKHQKLCFAVREVEDRMSERKHEGKDKKGKEAKQRSSPRRNTVGRRKQKRK